MELGGELLRAETISLHDLLGEGARLDEAVRVERDFGNGDILGNHHGHGTEQSLQVVRQNGPTSVTRIHRYEDVGGWLELDCGAFEEELSQALVLSTLDLEDLLRNDRENFKLDSIELIKATPAATRCEAFEEFSHGFGVEAICTIEHDAVDADCFGKVFGRFCLASASGAFGSSSKVELQSGHQSPIASIGQRCDDQPARVSQELVAVLQYGCDHPHVNRLALLEVVIAHLLDPLEVLEVVNAFAGQALSHVSRVHILHDERAERDPQQVVKLLPDHVDNLGELRLALLVELDHLIVRSLFSESFLDLKRPDDLRDDEDDLARPGFQPADALMVQIARALTEVIGCILHGDLWVVLEALNDHVLDAALHRLLQIVQPLFNLAIVLVRADDSDQFDLLALFADNLCDLVFLQFWLCVLIQSVEGDLVDAFEALFQVLLDAARLLRVAQDLDQVVV